MNADIQIRVGVNPKLRNLSERYRPTTTLTEYFELNTSLDAYRTVTSDFAAAVWDRANHYQSIPAEVNTRVAIRIENITHPTPARGVVPLAKKHIDFSLTEIEFTSAGVLTSMLNKKIADLQQAAKY